MDEIDYDSDSFEDVVARDGRYDPRAYAVLMDVVHYLGESGGHISSSDIMEEFRQTVLDQFGPMSYTVLSEWGLKRTEDIGEMMFNLVESRRVRKDDTDSADDFAAGYDFKEEFLNPYQA